MLEVTPRGNATNLYSSGLCCSLEPDQYCLHHRQSLLRCQVCKVIAWSHDLGFTLQREPKERLILVLGTIELIQLDSWAPLVR